MDVIIVISGAIVMGLLFKIQKKVTWLGYFSMSEIIINEKLNLTLTGMIFRFLVPTLIGFVVGIIAPENSRFLAGSVTFLGSLMLVLPALLYPEDLLVPELYSRKNQVFLIYALFVISNVLFGILGAQLTSEILPKIQPVMNLILTQPRQDDLMTSLIYDLLKTGIIGIAVFFIDKFRKDKVQIIYIEARNEIKSRMESIDQNSSVYWRRKQDENKNYNEKH
ncbi:MAG: hypothetical protein AAGU27_17085 [Dehalobacterium sp.]